MSNSHTTWCHPKTILLYAIIVAASWSVPAYAVDNLVSGKYFFSSETEIILNISIPNPAPANLIVEQHIASGNEIISTSPQARKIDKAEGKVKWLFKKTKDGILSLSIKLKSPLSGDISAMVRYRSPQGGAFTELRITP
ncbi:MAG: hypothetical protein OEL83_11520 [Desulforhopalus sp.]|nr:hypothetical protein [Desulforhopalus sp.]